MNVLISNSWNRFLEKFPSENKDIYFSEEYVKLYERESKACCCIVEEKGKLLLMPFLKRSFGSYFDFETPYGYGGPIVNTNDINWSRLALTEIKKKLEKERYICGFLRFHPLLNNASVYREVMNILDDRFTVSIDLVPQEEEIWNNQITSKNRNMIRKAEKSGLKFEIDEDFSHLADFKLLYNKTMEYLGAETFYFFDDKYYDEFKKNLSNNSFLGLVRKNDGEIVSAAIFMYNGYYGHYHLAGSNRDFSSLGMNNLMLWEAAKEFKRRNIKEFHLGGGTDGREENSLFKFKKSFSNHLKQFSIGTVIFNEAAYTEICLEWERKNPNKKEKYKNYLLKYRY